MSATIGTTLDFANSYSYDQLQRLTTLVQQGQSGGNAVTAKRITFGYNALSQRTSIDRFQSTGTSNPVAETDFTFDGANRLASLTHVRGSTTLAGYDYSYDPLSRITEIDSLVDGLSTYDYDQTSQLTGADHASQTDEAYAYDANGNRNTTGYVTGDNNRTLESRTSNTTMTTKAIASSGLPEMARRKNTNGISAIV